MAIDRREDAGEFYPGGKTISTQPVKGGGDMKHEDFADVAKLPDRFNDTMIHDKLNEVIGLLKGPVAAFALTLALDVLLGAFSVQGAGVTVETAPKGAIFNDEPVVTNVNFDATGLAAASDVYTKAETEEKIVELAPAPGNYAAVSNAAMNAVQPTNMPMLASYPMKQWGENINIAGDEYIDVSKEYHGTIAHRIFDGWYLSLSTDFWDQFSDVALSGSYNDLTDTPTIPTVPTAQINAATETNALQNAELESHASQLSQLSQSLDGKVPTSRTINGKALTSNISLSASEVGAATPEELDASDRILYALVEGTNIIDVVTNYESAINIPERLLVQIDTNGERKVVWRESTRHNATIEQLTAALDAATNALANATAALIDAKADRAWGKYTSGLGADAPADTLWISHPNTVLAGGLDWMKNVTTGGDVFVLTSNGMALEFENNPTNAAFFNLSSNGETIFRVEKTDERLVYVNISDVDVVGNYLLVGFSSWAYPTHPLLRVKKDLADAEWLKEEDAVDGEWAGVARFAWSGDGVNVPFVVTIENLTGGVKIFAGFSYTAPGETKIINNGVTDLSKGIFHNNKTYKWVVNGTKLELVEQQ